MENAFFGCSNLQITATDAPNLSNATDLSRMFSDASSMNAPLNNWDVSTIINMTGMFSGASAFNQPLNDWEVSEVTDMTGLFSGASAFNQSLATWDISNVTAMDEMLDNTALSLRDIMKCHFGNLVTIRGLTIRRYFRRSWVKIL